MRLRFGFLTSFLVVPQAMAQSNPCTYNANGLKYWCSTQGRCVANQYVCTAGSATSSALTYESTTSSSVSQSTATPACNTDPMATVWCRALQKCLYAASMCPSGYTSFPGPKTLNCEDGANCRSYVTSQGKCPNDSITMGHFYLVTNNGQYTIGEGCTVSCKGCSDSGTYVAPSGRGIASGYVSGGTTINVPGGGAGAPPDRGDNSVAVQTRNGIACFNPSTGTTTYTSGGGCGPQGGGGTQGGGGGPQGGGGGPQGGGGGNNKNNKPNGRQLRGG